MQSERKSSDKVARKLQVLAIKRPNSVQNTQNDGVKDFDLEMKDNEEFFQQYLMKD